MTKFARQFRFPHLKMPKVILKPGREASLKRRHPWVFSGAVAKVEGAPEPGETVKIVDSRGKFLAWAAFSPNSQIRARVWSWDQGTTINQELFRQRIRSAAHRRERWVDPRLTDAYRLIHAESDAIPGLIIDRYSQGLVVQLLSAGVEHWRKEIFNSLVEELQPAWIYERSDVEVRRLEGLPHRTGLICGELTQEPIVIRENNLRFAVDILAGQKTGFYLDQRDNRAQFGALATGKSVLNCFAYTGGFGVYALHKGAEHVVAVESSPEAIALGKRQIVLNHLPVSSHQWVQGDVFQVLREVRDQGLAFDRIVLDPPKFAPTAAKAKAAARGYKDINLLALKLLAPGGLLFSFSCSGGVSRDLFQKILAGAALDAGGGYQIVKWLHAGPDHPTLLSFPEGEYLKGLIVQKM